MRKVLKNSPVISCVSDTAAFLPNPRNPGPSTLCESLATLIAETAAMVSRLEGSLTFLAARMNFCLGVSGSGVEELRKRANMLISGWQLMTLSAGLEESGWHSNRLPGILRRVPSGTGILPGGPWLIGGNPGRLALFCLWPMTPSADRPPGSELLTGGS